MASSQHIALFHRYIERLEWAVNEALEFAESERRQLDEAADGDEARTDEEMETQGPLASNPYVLGAIREHWLDCARLNVEHPDDTVEPVHLIYDWLRRDRPELASILAELPYWPVGWDDRGWWV
jgi:hypothetical protein